MTDRWPLIGLIIPFVPRVVDEVVGIVEIRATPVGRSEILAEEIPSPPLDIVFRQPYTIDGCGRVDFCTSI